MPKTNKAKLDDDEVSVASEASEASEAEVATKGKKSDKKSGNSGNSGNKLVSKSSKSGKSTGSSGSSKSGKKRAKTKDASKASPKRRKKAKELESEEEEDDEEPDEEEAEEEEEDEEEGEETAEPTEEELLEMERHKAGRRKISRAVARSNGYRGLATQAGYTKADANMADGAADQRVHAVSISDVRRLAHFCPQTASNPSYSLAEFESRQKIAFEPIADGAARVLQANTEYVARKVMNRLVANMVEQGVKRATPSMLRSVIAGVASNMQLSCLAPLGLIRHGQDYREPKRVPTGPGRSKIVEGEVLLRMAAGDAEERAEETRYSSEIKATMAAAVKKERERKAAAAKKRADAKQEKQKLTAEVGA